MFKYLIKIAEIFTFIILFSISYSIEKKILFIGIDGCRADALEIANTPNIDSLIQNGIYNNEALSSINGQPTYSGPGWSSMVTGVWMDKHGVSDNSFSGSNFEDYPPFTSLLEENGNNYHMASFIMWSPIHTEIFNETMDYNELHNIYDNSVAIGAANYLENTPEIDLLFLAFDHVDHAGHSYGFGTQITNYINIISQVDEYIGYVINALENRPTYLEEEWLIIITSDHGGNLSGHGGQTIEERLIPIILSGNSVDSSNIPDQLYIIDIVPTLIQFLGEDIKCNWEIAGNSFGLYSNEYPIIECPQCPSQIQSSINYNNYDIELSWNENFIDGYQYRIYRNSDFLVELNGNIQSFIDFPNLIGIQNQTEINYLIQLETLNEELICSSSTQIILPIGKTILEQNFDGLELNPAQDEALIENGGCTDAIDENVIGWTNISPPNWTIDNTQMPNSGTIEWRGWSYATKQFWINAEDQLRSQFYDGNNILAIADPDEWDDCENASSFGSFNSTLSSPMIQVPSNVNLKLSFNSHYRNEAPQEAFLRTLNSLGQDTILMHYSNDNNSDNNGEDALNKFLQFSLPTYNSDEFQFNWEMANAGNNWYWAIDNIVVQIETPALGDINDDGIINILDIIIIVNIILGIQESNEILIFISDINRDGLVNIIDVIILLNYIIQP